MAKLFNPTTALNPCPGGEENPFHSHLSPQLQPLLYPTQNPGSLPMPPLRVSLGGQGSSYPLRLLFQSVLFIKWVPRFAHPGGDISAHPHKARLCFSIDSFESPPSSEPFSWMQISLSPSGGGRKPAASTLPPSPLHANGAGGRLELSPS